MNYEKRNNIHYFSEKILMNNKLIAREIYKSMISQQENLGALRPENLGH